MAVTKIEGKLVLVQISTNTVVPSYSTIVCATDSSLDGSNDVTRTKTKCGDLVSVSDTAWSLTGSGIASATPGAGELSIDELIAIMENGAEVLVKVAHATDTSIIYRQATAVPVSYTETHNEGELVSFDYGFEISGNLDITP